MLILLSPAKSLDLDTPPPLPARGGLEFPDDTAELAALLRQKSAPELMALMGVSEKIARLNCDRFAAFPVAFGGDLAARPALFTFSGEVYRSLDAGSLDAASVEWAERHLRILSGLYGLLRPLSPLFPYRLEMGTPLANGRGNSLYDFWGERIAARIALDTQPQEIVINLASNEYFRAVRPEALARRVVTPLFHELQGEKRRIVGVLAKKARGRMARYAILRRIDDPEALKAFDLDGYRFDPAHSDADTWSFARRERS